LKRLERLEKFRAVTEAVGAVGDPPVCRGIPDEGSLTGSPVARARLRTRLHPLAHERMRLPAPTKPACARERTRSPQANALK